MDIGPIVRCARKRRGVSQKDLCRKIGVSQNALSMIETGKSNPYKVTLEKIMKVLDLKTPEMLLISLQIAGPQKGSEKAYEDFMPIMEEIIKAIYKE